MSILLSILNFPKFSLRMFYFIFRSYIISLLHFLYHPHSFKPHLPQVMLKILPNVKHKVHHLTNQKAGDKNKDSIKMAQ